MSRLIALVALSLLAANMEVGAQSANHARESLLMERAEACRRDGELEEARRIYSQVLAIDSKNPTALEHRGDVLFRLGQYQKALEDANALVLVRPDDVSHLRRAIALIKLGNYEASLADLDFSLKYKNGLPHSVQLILMNKAIDALMIGRFAAARAGSYIHLNMMPRSALSFELCSVADALCGRQADCMSNLSRFAYTKLHYSELHSSSPSQAQDKSSMPGQLTRALEPGDGNVHHSWENGFFSQGAFTNEQREYLLARLKKDNGGLTPGQICFARAIIRFYEHDYAGARSETAHCPAGSSTLYWQLLDCYCQIITKDFPPALKTLNRLTELYSDSSDVLEAVDLYHYQADQRQAGIEAIKALLVKNPKNPAALAELAKIYHDLSELKESLKYCDLALQLKPNNADMQLLKANILTSQQKYAQGLNVLSALLAVDHQSGAAYMARAAIYAQQQRWADAVDDLSQCVRLRYDLIKAYRARAACYGALDKYELERQDAARSHET